MNGRSCRIVSVEDLTPGMVLHRSALNEGGRAVLHAGATLNARRIRGLQSWKVSKVEIEESRVREAERIAEEQDENSVEDPDTLQWQLNAKMPDGYWAMKNLSEVQAEDFCQEASEVVSTVSLPESFLQGYQSALQQVKTEMSKARFLQDAFSTERMKEIVTESLLPLLEDPDIFWKLQFVEHSEDYLYHHSVDVAILTGCISKWMSCPVEMQKKLMWGGLLHDIGKALIPLKIVNKSGLLTLDEYKIAQLHATRGYKYLQKNFNVPREIYYCVLQHHERLDGSGYPLSLPGEKIDIWARIVAIADVFSAMTSLRSYRRPYTSYDAAATLRADMYGKLDGRICSVFLEQLCRRFRGSRVLLSDGCEAEVVVLNDADDLRPFVRTDDGKVIDLSRKRNLTIRRVLY